MTDDQRIDMIEDQIEHIIELCKTYVEGDELEDVGNIRALYEEYGEWIDSYTGVDNSEENYTVMWAPDLTQVWTMNQEQIAAMLTVSENIQEMIEVVGELWEMSDFEVAALCDIVSDSFAEKGIKMEALICWQL